MEKRTTSIANPLRRWRLRPRRDRAAVGDLAAAATGWASSAVFPSSVTMRTVGRASAARPLRSRPVAPATSSSLSRPLSGSMAYSPAVCTQIRTGTGRTSVADDCLPATATQTVEPSGRTSTASFETTKAFRSASGADHGRHAHPHLQPPALVIDPHADRERSRRRGAVGSDRDDLAGHLFLKRIDPDRQNLVDADEVDRSIRGPSAGHPFRPGKPRRRSASRPRRIRQFGVLGDDGAVERGQQDGPRLPFGLLVHDGLGFGQLGPQLLDRGLLQFQFALGGRVLLAQPLATLADRPVQSPVSPRSRPPGLRSGPGRAGTRCRRSAPAPSGRRRRACPLRRECR